MSDFKQVNEFRKDLIKSLAYWCFSPLGILILMFIFDRPHCLNKIQVIDIALILLFSLLGLECISKVYKISLEIDKEKHHDNH
jgi:hypothetical protein